MTQEEKQLLLKEICARLPYGLIVQYKQKTFNPDGEYTINVKIGIDGMLCHRLKLLDFKPYLRPMSAMTEEEEKEFRRKCFNNTNWYPEKGKIWHPKTSGLCMSFDTMAIDIYWLNAHHFDYIGLIPMGLAIEAPERMYGENC